MIRYTQGNILDADADAIVNTVNTVGVMGKGIALMFKQKYPENFRVYADSVKKHEVQVGRILPVKTGNLVGPKWILNFPTKKHWRNPSKLEWIREGLIDLKHTIDRLNIHSVAVPPLGCGAGGLDWKTVRQLIEDVLGGVPGLELTIFEPTTVYQNTGPRDGVDKLTPPRALIAALVRQYEILGFHCSNLEVQKLAWLLEQSLVRYGAPTLDIRFTPSRYGPYSDRLRHLLDALDGTFLMVDKRIADAGPDEFLSFKRSSAPTLDDYLSSGEMAPYRPALHLTEQTIQGFESPLGMELLATVHWLLLNRNISLTVDSVVAELPRWPGNASIGARKARLFPRNMIAAALERLDHVGLLGKSTVYS